MLRLLSTLNLNRQELQHLEQSLARFEALLAQIPEAADQQAIHTAAKQEATKKFQILLTEGERQATILRLAVKEFYGIRAEKLVEFGLQPFRGGARKAEPETPPTPTPPSPEAKQPADADT